MEARRLRCGEANLRETSLCPIPLGRLSFHAYAAQRLFRFCLLASRSLTRTKTPILVDRLSPESAPPGSPLASLADLAR